MKRARSPLGVCHLRVTCDSVVGWYARLVDLIDLVELSTRAAGPSEAR